MNQILLNVGRNIYQYKFLFACFKVIFGILQSLQRCVVQRRPPRTVKQYFLDVQILTSNMVQVVTQIIDSRIQQAQAHCKVYVARVFNGSDCRPETRTSPIVQQE